jgi:hypothetical protein
MDAKLAPVLKEAEKAGGNWIASNHPVTAGIDLPLARKCVNVCARAYQSETFGSDLAHVLVEQSEGPAIIAFRGSSDVKDWLTDFRVGFCYTQFGRMHKGFWESSTSVMAGLMKLDQRAIIAPVILTGHSKGAAEAIICARRLAALGRPIQAVVTFGGPRGGDAMWRAHYNSQETNYPSATGQHQTLGEATMRWVIEEDIVPRLPAWIAGYRHVGTEVFVSAFGGVEVNPPLWRKAASDLWGTFWGYKQGRIEQAVDHPVSKYVEHLNSL